MPLLFFLVRGNKWDSKIIEYGDIDHLPDCRMIFITTR